MKTILLAALLSVVMFACYAAGFQVGYERHAGHTITVAEAFKSLW